MAEHIIFWPPPGDTSDFVDWEQFVGATVDTKYGSIAANDLWLDFRDSDLGQYFETQPRRYMQHFGYNPQQMDKDLGLDVSPNGHQLVTATYKAWVLMAELRAGRNLPLPEELLGISRLIDLFHDTGELTHPEIKAIVGAVVGDIPAGEKTDEQRAIETSVRSFVYQRFLPSVPARTIAIMESVITHEDDSPLHQAYELAHHLQTADTTLRAKRKAAERARGTLPREQAEATLLRKLHEIVLPPIKPKIAEFAGRYAIAEQITAIL